MVIWVFLFSFISHIFSQNCLYFSSTCFTCLSDFYENEQNLTLNLAFPQGLSIKEENCIQKVKQKNIRKLLIGVEGGNEYNQTYGKINQALIQEFKIAIK